MCGSRKYTYPPHGRSLEIPRGREGGSQKAHVLWGRYGYFLESYNTEALYITVFYLYIFSATQLSNLGPMYPPEWTPQPQMPARTPLPSTLMRVSPSPNRGSKSSPIITVSTTSTPIQPLQGNKQQYVIVQGNHRHLQGTASYKDSFTTPTLQENHQPIYLQGKKMLIFDVPQFCWGAPIFTDTPQ